VLHLDDTAGVADLVLAHVGLTAPSPSEA
jgi:hypothetical protein